MVAANPGSYLRELLLLPTTSYLVVADRDDQIF
jgi:hypothetical protein